MATPLTAAITGLGMSRTSLSRRRDRRKAEIVRETIRLLATDGYQAVSVEQVVEATDIAKATLYHYFSSNDELVAEALDALTIGVIDRWRRCRPPPPSSPAVTGCAHVGEFLCEDLEVALQCHHAIMNNVSIWVRRRLDSVAAANARTVTINAVMRVVAATDTD